jgi:hypothetical protein
MFGSVGRAIRAHVSDAVNCEGLFFAGEEKVSGTVLRARCGSVRLAGMGRPLRAALGG